MRERGMTESEIETALRDLGAHMAYPRMPDLLPAVRARLEERPAPALWRVFWSPRLAVVPALATIALLLAAALALQPIGASAAEAIGLRGLQIFRAPTAPPAAAGSALLSDARAAGSSAEASRLVGFTVLEPASLGRPDAIYVRTTPQGSQAFLVYGPRTGIAPSAQTGVSVLVTEARGTVEVPLLGKVVGPGSRVEQLTVNGARAVWIEGAPHQFFFRSPAGEIVVDTLRLAGNVLVWEQAGVLVRIEADVPKDAALRIAATVR
ncbi:MAG: hypothetical protein HYX56_02205 [Chloroflexi bacterium]|nr:hypothetical protein [Chloroflexota bacterium]